MPATWLQGLESFPVDWWLIGVIGFLSACGAVVLGRSLLRRRVRPVLPPPSKERSTDHAERDPFVEGGSRERRASLRRLGKQVRVVIADPAKREKRYDGWVMDRSMGGICLSTYETFQPGDRIEVIPDNAPSGTQWVDVEVRSVREDGGRFELGCQFVVPPTWAVLLLFG